MLDALERDGAAGERAVSRPGGGGVVLLPPCPLRHPGRRRPPSSRNSIRRDMVVAWKY